MANPAPANRVEFYIAQSFPEVLLVEGAGGKAPLPHMSAGAIGGVPVGSKRAMNIFQAARQGFEKRTSAAEAVNHMRFTARLKPCPSYRVSPHLESVPQGLKL